VSVTPLTIVPSHDAALVADLTREAWKGTVDARSSGQRFTSADVHALFAKGAVALIARDPEGAAVGSVIVVPDGPTVCELMKLAVPDRDRRNHGVGSALLDAAVNTAKVMGAGELLLAVSLYQPQLCRYYARRGFVVVPGRVYRHASPDAPGPIVMVRALVNASGASDAGDASRPTAAADPLGDAARALLDGHLVVLPTETVYGLGALASDPVAVRRVFATKGRPVDHPLIVHIADRSAMSHWAAEVPAAAWTLAGSLWPGPLTLVLRKAGWVPAEVTGGLDTIALRVPRHTDALAVLGLLPEHAGIAAPSANRFGKVSPTTVADVAIDLAGLLVPGDLIIDGGPCALGVESTIVDLTTDVPTILRPGGCPVEQIEAVLGRPVERVASGPSRAPGMLAAHYAPMAGVLVVEEARAAAAAMEAVAVGRKVGLLAPRHVGPVGPVGPAASAVVRLDAPDPYTGDSLAPVLYARLREADRLGLEVLVIVAPDEGGLGLAVNDRLRRAEVGSRRASPAG
jgi:L-threonylcarbamoyladenylate synthase